MRLAVRTIDDRARRDNKLQADPATPHDVEKGMIKIKRLRPPKKESPRSDETLVLIDCGRARERTRGSVNGFSLEGGFPPFNWWIPF